MKVTAAALRACGPLLPILVILLPLAFYFIKAAKRLRLHRAHIIKRKQADEKMRLGVDNLLTFRHSKRK